jgi:homoserine dehydrogenase
MIGPGPDTMRAQRIALIGAGGVGRALLALLRRKAPELEARYGLAWRLTGVAGRRRGWLAGPAGLDVDAVLRGEPGGGTAAGDVRAWLAAARPDVVFEAIPSDALSGEPALGYLRAALEHGAHAITANKGALVHGYPVLRELARAHGRAFLHEAAFMGGAPVFALFRRALPAARLVRFRGILNATTTLILETMEGGGTFAEGVARAQGLGVAETDPSADVDGWDAALKVATLATVVMDRPLALREVTRTGIRDLAPAAVRAARAGGHVVRLVSRLEPGPGGLQASVRPERLEPGDPLAGVRGASLLAHFELDTLPGLLIGVHEGGPHTTAYDMLCDFVTAVGGGDAGPA